jgi:hypothetical protein
MRIEILQSIAGRGDFVGGFSGIFSLSPGDQVEVENQIAEKWIASGIAKVVEQQTRSAETAMLAKPPAKARKGRR